MAVQTPEARQQRERAKALYMAGLPPSEIAVRLGINRNTLRIWGNRGKWPTDKKRASQASAAILDHVTTMTMADSILQHQKRVSAVVDVHIDSLSSFQPVQAKEFVEVGQALKHLDDVGRRNLGMIESSSGNKPTTFNFNLSKMEFPSENEVRTIDVTSAPLSDQTHNTSSENKDNITETGLSH